MAETAEEEQRRRRRKRLIRGLLVGSAALGLPALVNAMVARRAQGMPPASWGQPQRYSGSSGEVVFQHFEGDGSAVVLLHSLGPGHSGLQWREVGERLGERHDVYVPDWLGWGESDHPSLVYDGDLYIQQLIDFLGDIVARRAAVVAAGLSAAYAIQVAVDHPELLSALCLVTPVGIDLHGDEPDIKDAILHRLLKLPILGTSALNVFTSKAGIAGHLRRDIFNSEACATTDRIEQHYRLSHLPGAHGGLAAYVSGYLNHSVSQVVSRVEQPVTIVWGREARSPAVESADLWLHHLPTAELSVLESCGSLPHYEKPDSFVAVLDDFLDRQT